MEKASELIVARDPALAVAQDVDSRHVPGDAVWGRHLAHEGAMVVVCDGAWVVDAEGEESVSEGGGTVDNGVPGMGEDDGGDRESGTVSAGGEGEESDIV
jgi:hypothetical protein